LPSFFFALFALYLRFARALFRTSIRLHQEAYLRTRNATRGGDQASFPRIPEPSCKHRPVCIEDSLSNARSVEATTGQSLGKHLSSLYDHARALGFVRLDDLRFAIETAPSAKRQRNLIFQVMPGSGTENFQRVARGFPRLDAALLLCASSASSSSITTTARIPASREQPTHGRYNSRRYIQWYISVSCLGHFFAPLFVQPPEIQIESR
jgi:hypothetical protein